MFEDRAPVGPLLKGHVAGSTIDFKDGDNTQKEQHHPKDLVAFEEITEIDVFVG